MLKKRKNCLFFWYPKIQKTSKKWAFPIVVVKGISSESEGIGEVTTPAGAWITKDKLDGFLGYLEGNVTNIKGSSNTE